MTEISWNGAVSSDFLEAGNWDTTTTPGAADQVIINSNANASVLGGSASIASLEIGASLSVSGQLFVSGLTTVLGGPSSLTFAPQSSSVLAQLAVGASAVVTNNGSLSIGALVSTPDVGGAGQLHNFGDLQLNGAMYAQIMNFGSITISGQTAIEGYDTVSNDAQLIVKGPLEIGGGRQTFSGSVEIDFGSNPMVSTGIFADGVLAIGLSNLLVDTSLAGPMTAGSEKNLFHTAITAVDAFSIANFSVTGQHSDFAYALRVIGIDSFASGVSLLALNSGATGGRAVLDQSASSRAVTLAINTDTGRGTIHGGSFADAHASLLHGVDEVRGGSGNDVLTVNGGAAGFTFDGGAGNDQLTGGVGNDALSAGTGTDTLIGGAGNDTYVTNGGDTLTEAVGGGTDTVVASVSLALGANLEHLVLTGTAAIATGNALANRLTGNAAANTLNGGTGADTLIGGGGNDTYLTNGGDTLTEAVGGGTDTVVASVSLALGANLEHLVLTGTAAIATGNALANRLTGNAAANTLNGGTGTDTLIGGGGNDTYVTNGGDTLTEAVGGGTDTVVASVSLALGANLEHLILTGTAAIGTGNALANRITGNAAANTLSGAGGADTLIGGAGADKLIGGKGADRLSGGTGADVFVFVAGSGRDVIGDFKAKGVGSDDIDFSVHSRITGFADLVTNHMTASGNNVVIKTGTDTITLLNVRLADLDASDFLF